ncbi:MAG: hypothetical protein QW567_03160 [Candidatus Hadarchaeales archaeon]
MPILKKKGPEVKESKAAGGSKVKGAVKSVENETAKSKVEGIIEGFAEREVVKSDAPLKMKVDQLEASVTALMALREPTEARLSMLNEKIGELRTMILSQAKDSADAKAKAERALGALEGIKPEEFRSMIMRRDKDIEGLKAKFSLIEDEIKELRKEIAGYRDTMAKFKGFETVVGMADEARKNIMRIQQLRDQVELMSDKVMSAFMEFQRRLREVTDMTVRLGVVEENLKTISKTLSQMDATLKQALPKADFDKFVSTQLGERLKSGVDPSEFSKMRELVEVLKEADEKNQKRFARIEREIKVVETGISKLLDALI